MAWVRGSALGVGRAVSGQRTQGMNNPYYYHHPYLIVGTGNGNLYMRNCTSHPSANFQTLEITDGQKTGGPHWKTGRSSYLVLNADSMTVSVAEYLGDQVVGFDTVEEPIPPQQVVDPSGQVHFFYTAETRLVTYPRLMPIFGNVEFSDIGGVTAGAMQAIQQALA